jgi:hypothetical protein
MPPRGKIWKSTCARPPASPLALLKPNNVTNLDHTLRLPLHTNETKEMAQLTHDWLRSRSHTDWYDPITNLCLYTNCLVCPGPPVPTFGSTT